MEHHISPSADGKYIILKYVGNITARLAINPTIEAHVLGEKLKIDRYLVDATEARNVDTVLENYTFVHEYIKGKVNMYARVALLVAPDDSSHDFIVTASQNVSSNMRKFTDRESAERYLLA